MNDGGGARSLFYRSGSRSGAVGYRRGCTPSTLDRAAPAVSLRGWIRIDIFRGSVMIATLLSLVNFDVRILMKKFRRAG